MLAVQLMKPTAAAAAELVKNALGSAQNDGRYAMVPNATNVKTITNSTALRQIRDGAERNECENHY